MPGSRAGDARLGETGWTLPHGAFDLPEEADTHIYMYIYFFFFFFFLLVALHGLWD